MGGRAHLNIRTLGHQADTKVTEVSLRLIAKGLIGRLPPIRRPKGGRFEINDGKPIIRISQQSGVHQTAWLTRTLYIMYCNTTG